MDLERLNQINFWQRVGTFVQAVQTNNIASEGEKEMILNVCTLMEFPVENMAGDECYASET